MNNKENKIDILKEIIKENEELKEQNKKLENKLFWANNNNNYNEYWFKHWYEENKKSQEKYEILKKRNQDLEKDWTKDHNKQYTEIETLKTQLAEMQQQQKAYTTPVESIEQLEYLQKALNKKGTVDMKFIKSTVTMLLKAMKYNKLCESHKKEVV